MAPRTRARVRAVMARLGYRPNLLARGLVLNETRVMAAIVPDLNPHVLPILRGIADECRRNEYALMVSSTEYWTDELAAYQAVADNWRVDGVILYNVVYRPAPSAAELAILKQGIPCVFINKYLRARAVDSVSVDNAAAVRLAVDHLVELGHRRIGILNGSRLAVDGVERLDGFRRALAAQGLVFDPSICGDANFSDTEAFEEMRRILRARRPPTALFCANDLMAIGACRAAAAAGLAVPRDLSLVGFDDIEAGQFHRPAITTLRPPLRDLGRRALELLVARIREPARRPEQTALAAKLIVRDSTGPCPARFTGRPGRSRAGSGT